MGFFSRIFDKNEKKKKEGSVGLSSGASSAGAGPAVKVEPASELPPAPAPPRKPLEFIGPNNGMPLETPHTGYREEKEGKVDENSPYPMGRSPVQRQPQMSPHPNASTSSIPKFPPGDISGSSSSSIDTTASSSGDCSTPATTPSTSSPSVVSKGNGGGAHDGIAPGTITPPSPHGTPVRKFNASPLSSSVDPSMLPTPPPSPGPSRGVRRYNNFGMADPEYILRKSRSSSHLPMGHPNGSSASIRNGMHGSFPMSNVHRPRSSMANTAPHGRGGYFPDTVALAAPRREETATHDSLLNTDPIGRAYHLYPTPPPVSTPSPSGKRASSQPTQSYMNHLYRRRVVHPTTISEELLHPPQPHDGYLARPPLRSDARRRSFHSVSSATSLYRPAPSPMPMPMPGPPPMQSPGPGPIPGPRSEHHRRRSSSNGVPMPTPPPGQYPHPPPHGLPPNYPPPHHAHPQHPQQRAVSYDARLRIPQPRRGTPAGGTNGRGGKPDKPVEDMLLGLNMLQILERQEQEAEMKKEMAIEEREARNQRGHYGQGGRSRDGRMANGGDRRVREVAGEGKMDAPQSGEGGVVVGPVAS